MKRNFFIGIRIAFFLVACLGFVSFTQAETYLSETKYDWSGLANSITSQGKSNYDKAYDIYRWLCNNIDYDTSYSIHTADETYENHRGVCQGYVELYHRLGNAVGLKSDIIFGKSKDIDGKIGDIGHAWLFVYIDENTGILVDPTWGAGSVHEGRFERNVTDDWFHVSPQWSIFTHYPDDERYQLIDRHITFTEFGTIPSYNPSLAKYGFDGKSILTKSLSGQAPALPTFYSNHLDSRLEVLELPREKTLHVGKNYEFYFKPKSDVKLAIINGDEFYYDWVSSGTQTAARYMPARGGKLKIAYLNGNNKYTTLVEYDIATPTASELATLETTDPLRSPYFDKVKNFDIETIRKVDINPHILLKTLKENNINALPKIYSQTKCSLKEVPLTERLERGKEYTFRMGRQGGYKWAIINGDDTWNFETENGGGSEVVITVTANVGKLRLAVQTPESGERYQYVAEYEVK